jgi:hypothetical protein
MPVILPESAVDAWIAPSGAPEEIVKTALSEMCVVKA